MWKIVGHDHAITELKSSLKAGRLSHAYLFSGPRHTGKATLAMNLAQALNCVLTSDTPCDDCSQCRRIASGYHTDVEIISPSQSTAKEPLRKLVGIDSIRAIESRAYLEPYEGSYRVFIFADAESMSTEAANALLKTLEEPPPRCIFLLLTSQYERILPTIISRCRSVELSPLPLTKVLGYIADNYSVQQAQADKIARLSQGCLGWAILALANPNILEQRRSELERIINLIDASIEQRFNAASDLASLFSRDNMEAQGVLGVWLSWWRDLLMVSEGAEESVYNLDYIEVLRDHAQRYSPRQIASFTGSILSTLNTLDHNVSARLSLEVLMLSMPERETFL